MEIQSPAPREKQPHAPGQSVWADWLGSSSAAKTPEVLGDTKFTRNLVTQEEIMECIAQSCSKSHPVVFRS